MGSEWLRPSVAVVGNLMYVLGGFGDVTSPRGAQARVMTHDLTTNMNPWTTTGTASMGTKRDNMSAVVLGGRIYAFGGNAVGCGLGGSCTVGTEHRSAEVYDPSTNTWTPIPAMFTARKDFDSVVLNGQIYVFGGRGGGEYLGAMERYTP
jgi:N-acetylneuraminic acid mutarotase